jgi:hypothetical protein
MASIDSDHLLISTFCSPIFSPHYQIDQNLVFFVSCCWFSGVAGELQVQQKAGNFHTVCYSKASGEFTQRVVLIASLPAFLWYLELLPSLSVGGQHVKIRRQLESTLPAFYRETGLVSV